jgi:hypothetical protein
MTGDDSLEIIAHLDRRVAELRADIRDDRQERNSQHAGLTRRVEIIEAKIDRQQVVTVPGETGEEGATGKQGSQGKPGKDGPSMGVITTIATIVSAIVLTVFQAIQRSAGGGGVPGG